MRRSVSAYASNDLGAGDIAHDIEVVDGEIDHHAHIDHAHGKRALAPRIDLEHTAQFTRRKVRLKGDDRGVEAFDVADHQLGAAPLGRRDQLLAFLYAEGDRFLDQQMNPASDDGRRDPAVQDGGYCNAHGVRAKLIQHPLEVGIRLSAELLGHGCGGLVVEISHTNQIHTRQVRIDARVVTSHRTHADNSGPNCHKRSSVSPAPLGAKFRMQPERQAFSACRTGTD